ncbi:hypothetical protein HYV86_03850 [Candidatus Woesearchaeota archaeon]|nr:hypothetical protein [Candidatus Woesearchaeota archaeon]
MISNKGSVLVQVAVIAIVAAITTGIMLLLIYVGAFEESSDQAQQVSLLNTEFIPLGRGGDLQIRQFDFCKYVDVKFNCYQKTDVFAKGDEIYLRFLVQSSTYDNQIMLVRNYRIVNPQGNIILNLEEKNSYLLEHESTKENEPAAFADYFTLGDNPDLGEYQVEIMVENPLLDKRISLVKRFRVE